MAIGVLSVGLLGVAALIPLAMHQAERGLSTDRAAAAARRAYREFEVRGMANPRLWATYQDLPPLLTDTVMVAGNPTVVPLSLCLDPIGLTSPTLARNKFPAISEAIPTPPGMPKSPTMERIKLALWPSAVIPAAKDQEVLYRELFSALDDLDFERPTNARLPSEQQFVPNQTNPAKRLAGGRFSWMATLVPRPQLGAEMATLSIVVMERRNNPKPDDERVFDMNLGQDFFSGGIAGGDVRLRWPAASGLNPTLVRERLEELRSGQWIMLSQFLAGTLQSRWYRVQSVGDIDMSTKSIELTLHGPDWNPNEVTQATWIKGVVAVFEKTIRLEGSSLWTN